jgi:hypothetical protein
MGAAAAVQRGLFQALGTLGYPVQDVAPQNGVLPCIIIGEIVFAPMDTKDRNGFDFVARIHVRSEGHNLLPVRQIQDAIYDRLHNATDDVLAIVGCRLILLRREMSDVIREAQGQIHGVCEYRGLIETV